MISLLAGEKPGESLLNWVVWIFPKISTGVPVERGNVKKKILGFWAQYMLYIRRLLRRNKHKTSRVPAGVNSFTLVYLMTTCSSAAACFSSYNEIWIPIWTLRERIPGYLLNVVILYWRLINTCPFGEEITWYILLLILTYILVKINNENAFEKETEDWS